MTSPLFSALRQYPNKGISLDNFTQRIEAQLALQTELLSRNPPESMPVWHAKDADSEIVFLRVLTGSNDKDLVEWLYNKCISGYTDFYGDNLLAIAVRCGDEILLNYLHQTNREKLRELALAISNDGNTIFHACAEGGSENNLQIIAQCLGAVFVQLPPDELKLELCASENQNFLVRAPFGIDINQQDNRESGDTPLISAVRNNNPKMVADLIRFGANVHQCNKKGWYPIHVAAEKGFVDIVGVLLGAGAVVNQPTNNVVWGDTPLIRAVRNNNPKMVAHLISFGADVNQCNKNGWYPIHLAAEKGFIEISCILLDAGAVVDQPQDNQWGDTPLIISVSNNKIETVKHLIVRGASVHKCNKKGLYPIYIAADKGFIDIVCVLLDAGADVDQQAINKHGDIYKKALRIAIINNQQKIMQKLIAAGASVWRWRGLPVPPEFLDFLLDNYPHHYLVLVKTEKAELVKMISNRQLIPKSAALIGETISEAK